MHLMFVSVLVRANLTHRSDTRVHNHHKLGLFYAVYPLFPPDSCNPTHSHCFSPYSFESCWVTLSNLTYMNRLKQFHISQLIQFPQIKSLLLTLLVSWTDASKRVYNTQVNIHFYEVYIMSCFFCRNICVQYVFSPKPDSNVTIRLLNFS